jgi:aconitate hydratase
VLLKIGDDVSTDEISAAGAQALPFRLNIPKLAEFAFTVMAKAVERKRRMMPSAMPTARW